MTGRPLADFRERAAHRFGYAEPGLAAAIDRGAGTGDSGGVELAYSLSIAGGDLIAAGICLLIAVGTTGCKGAAAPPVHPEWSVPEALPGAEPFGDELRERLDLALKNMPADYRPRTHHLRSDGAPEYTNRLILESSPYLLQHAHNPVNWYPWGEEAFAEARRLGRPILLSVGYSTCHWCHVMERESFEDEEIAAFINSHFIAIKVDREERPDVDRVYMEAVQLISGRGGWPMTVVMTPDRVPFFAGTYFPARDGDRGARIGFLTLLRRLSAHYQEHPDDIEARAAALSQKMRELAEPEPAAGVPGPAAIARTVSTLARGFDSEHGGFGGAPKFPRPVTLELLLRYQRRTGDGHALEMVRTTLEAMARGGIHDQIGGGFHRYSTDERWLVPHFEKMLYDNAQLAMIYLDAYQATGDEEFAEVARRTLEYAMREMSGPAGEFYSATDADSPNPEGEQEEGWFFTWTPQEIAAVLDPDAAKLVRLYYGVTDRGNFEGRNIFSVVQPLADVAGELDVEIGEARSLLERARQTLYQKRLERPAPGTDDKAVAAWNGLMISALARGAIVLGDERFRERAAEAGRFIVTQMIDGDGRLVRSWKAGRRGPAGVLDDYAFVASGFLDLFEATSDRTWLERAVALHEQLAERFWDDSAGGYYFTASDGEELLMRDKPSYDGAEPSGNSIAVADLLRLYEWTGRQSYREMAEKALAYFAREMESRGVAVPKLLCALDAYLDKTKEIVIVAPKDGGGIQPFLDRLRTVYLPNRVFVATTEDRIADLASIAELVEDKRARGGKTTAYVCENRVCDLPTSDPETFAKQIAVVRSYGD